MRYSELSDTELCRFLSEGDPAAYTEIYNRYKQMLYLHAYRKLDNREEAKDVVQELFTVLWTNRSSLVFTSTLAGYLFSSVRNRIINIFLRRGVELKYTRSLEDLMSEGVYATDHLVREKELAAQIRAEVDRLPSRMKEIFQLSRESDLSHRKIAEKLNLSEQTVRTQIRNALRILRVRIGSFKFILIHLLLIFR